MANKQITVKLKKSVIACTEKQQATVRGLGSTKTLENTPAVRGMIKQVIHMVDILK